MTINILGRKVTLKQDFLQRVETKLRKHEKLFSDSAEVQVTVTVEKDWQRVEITVRDKGLVARAERMADQMEEALDAAVDVLLKQVVRNHKRIEKSLRSGAAEFIAQNYQPEDPDDYVITKEKQFYAKPITIEEAIVEMNLIGHDFYMFFNITNEKLNVVYKRKNGTYGLLNPQ